MWSAGTGADVMKRIAAPMIGGIFTSFLLELVVYPAIYEIWKWHFGLKRELALAVSPAQGEQSCVCGRWSDSSDTVPIVTTSKYMSEYSVVGRSGWRAEAASRQRFRTRDRRRR
jgi:hypothetical protein